MVPILRLCAAANFSRSGRRAMLPSSLRISTITELGENPARRARSQPASVCPARTSTPPGCAISGKMCPGCTRSCGCASGLTAARTVVARSAAEIPVVTPSAASIETVKLVDSSWLSLLTISGRRSWRQRSLVSVRQIRPRPYLAMKLIASGVVFSDARIRSPSFSRSSSSMMMTIRPRRRSSMISSVVFSAMSLQLFWQTVQSTSLALSERMPE